MSSEKIDLAQFESSLTKLESIVKEMDDGNTPLEKLINKYSDGVQLFKQCKKMLDHAELKISNLSDELQKELDD